MVTRNPARTLHWPTGEIRPGRGADLLMIRRAADSPTGGMPDSPYRNLIDATARDVRLVLVGGAPVAGDPRVMRSLLGRDIQLVRSTAGHYVKALTYSRSGVMPPPSLRFAYVQRALGAACEHSVATTRALARDSRLGPRRSTTSDSLGTVDSTAA